MDKKRPPSHSLALRLLDWLLVGAVVLLSAAAGMALSEIGLRNLSLTVLWAAWKPASLGLTIALIVIMTSMSLLMGVFIDTKIPRLSIFAPWRFGQHIIFGLLWGATLALGIYGLFRRSYEADAHDLAWYLRDVYTLGISVYLYWLIYKVPERIQSLRREVSHG